MLRIEPRWGEGEMEVVLECMLKNGMLEEETKEEVVPKSKIYPVLYTFSLEEQHGVKGVVSMTTRRGGEEETVTLGCKASVDTAFSCAGQNPDFRSIAELVQNAQDACVREAGHCTTGRLGDGMKTALSCLIGAGFEVRIEVSEAEKEEGVFFRVEDEGERGKTRLRIVNTSVSSFDASSVISGHSDKRESSKKRTSVKELCEAMQVALFSKMESETPLLKTVVRVESEEKEVRKDDFFFGGNSEEELLLEAEKMRMFCRVSESGNDGKGRIRVFESNLYIVEEELDVGFLVDVNVVASDGTRVSHSRDRTFGGFLSLPSLSWRRGNCIRRVGEVLLALPFLRRLDSFPIAASLLSFLSPYLSGMWPYGVVGVRDEEVAEDAASFTRMEAVVVKDASILKICDPDCLFRCVEESAVYRQDLSEAARDACFKVGGAAPQVFSVSATKDSMTRLLSSSKPSPAYFFSGDLPITGPSLSVKRWEKNKLIVSEQTPPERIPYMMIAQGQISVFSLLDSVLDKKERRNVGLFTPLPGASPSLREPDTFVPCDMVVEGEEIEVVPSGPKVRVEEANSHTLPHFLRSDFGLDLPREEREAAKTDFEALFPEASSRVRTGREATKELMERPYGACVLKDVEDKKKPLQCKARAIFFVLASRAAGGT